MFPERKKARANHHQADLVAAAGHGHGQSVRPDPFGIIGAGERGTYHARRLAQRAEAEVVSICDVYRVRADGARDRSNPQADAVQDYRRVLDRKDIDAVVISVSDHWHTQILMDSVTAGKDAYLEKPMTYRIDDGHEIVRAVKRTGRIVQVGTQQKSGPHFLEAKERFFDSGLIVSTENHADC